MKKTRMNILMFDGIPEEAEKLALQKEVTDLKGQMLQMSQSVNALLEQNKQLMEQIKSERNNTKKLNKE